MNDFEFWSTEDPLVVGVEGGAQVSLSAAFSATGIIAVARLDGSEMLDEDSVFLGFYTAFRFPEYFGWNWDALSDCLRGLEWCPADRYLVLIDRADQLLAEEPMWRSQLFSVLRRVADQWANPLTSRRHEAVPFKVVLLCSEDHVDGLRRELLAA